VAVKRRLLIALCVIVAAYGLLVVIIRPSNDRDWAVDQSRLASAEFNGPVVTIQNVRNFRYASADRYDAKWGQRTYDLRRLESAWFVVEPFGGFEGAAHTFVSFGFGGGEFVAVSIEIRKEKGESFSALKGLLRQYELMYLVGDERDLIGLRANYRHDPVFLYPIRTTPERRRAMFVDMLTRANELVDRPEMYNTLTNTCTTNLVDHVNTIVPGRVPLRAGVIFPGYSDRLAYDVGLIETTLPFDAARAHFRINERAQRYADDPQFSLRIRDSLLQHAVHE
jgi:hypothetical protein